jgi:glycosyltransferase involved in cell wall biosynthesis
MKKILIFSTAYLPFIGGAEIAVKEITDRLFDFHFDMITARINGKLSKIEKIGNVNVYRIGIGIPKIDKYSLAFSGHYFAQKLHKKNNYNAVWAIMASFGTLATLWFKQKLPEIPYVLTLQEGDPIEYIHSRAKWLGPYYQAMFKKADFITAISQYLKNYAIENGAKCEIEVVPNGVDLKKFQIKNLKNEIDYQEKIQKIKEELGIKPNEKIVITVSRLVLKNGIEHLIEAFKYLPKSQEEKIVLMIIGSGPLEKKLKTKVENLGLKEKVLFLGNIPNKEVPKYLAMSDIFVRPSISEGLGNAFLEAMAVGIPIIGTPVGGIPDFLKDGETGLFCEVANPKSIAEKINILLTNENLCQKLIENGRKLVEEKYNWDLIAEKMRNIFNKLCES